MTIHEYAHGWMAYKMGDPTAKMAGRLTFNPIPHLDFLGTAMLFLVHFGWAKPVPVNPGTFRNRKWGDIRVSLAGITANFILAILFTLLILVVIKLRGLTGDLGGAWGVIGQAASYGVFINFILAIFNLIPIPPLDGSHVLYHLLPARIGARYRELGRYGLVVIMMLVFVVPGAINILLWPVQFLVAAADACIGLWI